MVTDFFDRHTLEEWNLYCRRNRVGFVNANCIGTMLNIFIDFGSLKVFDRIYHGLNTNFYIENISNEAFGVVSVSKNQPHYLRTGDYVTIHEVEGMTEVNGDEPRPVKVIDEFSFSIENTKRFGTYKNGGYVTLEKVPFLTHFKSFKNNLSEPKFIKT